MEKQAKKQFQIKWPGVALIILLVLLIAGYFIAQSYSQYEENNYNMKQDILRQRETQNQVQKLIDSNYR